MKTEKALLQQIREKELLLNIKIEDARREAEQKLTGVKEEARVLIETSEKEEEANSRAYYETEMEKLREEIGEFKGQAEKQTQIVKEQGERGLPRAISLIIRSVSME